MKKAKARRRATAKARASRFPGLPPRPDAKYLGLMVRCCGEYWMEEFCAYYLSQGVDEIHIISDRVPVKFYANLKNDARIHITHVKSTFSTTYKRRDPHHGEMMYLNKRYKKIRRGFKWMIVCDADEFITTRKNVNRTIREELKETFDQDNVDIIMVPWVIMSCGGRKKSPKSILSEITQRWDHDKKHFSRSSKKVNIRSLKFRCLYRIIPSKSIFRTTVSSRGMITSHRPYSRPNKKRVDSINIKPTTKCHYKGLREKDIKNGYLLCYHYRTISLEFVKQKLKDSKLYQVYGFGSKQLMKYDFPEIRDETLKHKITNCGDFFAK